MRFVDTNVLLYSVSKAGRERAKADIALRLLEAQDLALSVQVLQEFYVQSTRPGKASSLTHDQAALFMESFVLRFPVQEITLPLLESALKTKQRFRISYWDAAVVEAARVLGCSILLSEDLNDGQDFAGVEIENPFRGLA